MEAEPLMILRFMVFGGIGIMLFWWLVDQVLRWWARRRNGWKE